MLITACTVHQPSGVRQFVAFDGQGESSAEGHFLLQEQPLFSHFFGQLAAYLDEMGDSFESRFNLPREGFFEDGEFTFVAHDFGGQGHFSGWVGWGCRSRD